LCILGDLGTKFSGIHLGSGLTAGFPVIGWPPRVTAPWLSRSREAVWVGAGRIAILAIARQYFDLANETSSPSLSASYQRIADGYRVQAQGELRILERERASAADRPRP
jgi:hypothetical protein